MAKDSFSPSFLNGGPLKQARLLRGWSQEDVAGHIGTDGNTVGRWERGRTRPSPYFRQKLCELFDKSALDLGLVSSPQECAALPVPPSVASELALLRPLPSLSDPTIPLRLAPKRALIGRKQYLTELAQRLCDQEQHQLIALYGLPGIGKTALVAELANTPLVQAYFAGGILWAGLGPQAAILPVLSRWGTLCGLSTDERQTLRNEDEWSQALRAAIGTRRMLLIIDDVWEMEDALRCKIGGLHCSYLLTTRSPRIAVQFAGNQAVHIPELSLDDGVQLITRIAPALAEMNPEEPRSLVRAVGGHPLALTLMGKHLQIHTHHVQPRRTQAALARLQQFDERLRLELLQAGLDRDMRLSSGAPLTLQAIIRMSDMKLDATLRQALSALSVFPAKPNAFSEEAALAVTATDVEALDQLVDAGLVEVNSQGRYQLHQMVSDYEKSQGKNRQAEERAIDYMLSWAEKHQDDCEVFEQELVNIMTSIQYAFEQNLHEKAIRGTLVSARFLRDRGLHSLAEKLLQQALSCSNAGSNEKSRREILSNLVDISQALGNYDQAERFASENLALLRQRTDTPEALCALLASLGQIYLHKGDYDQAQIHVQEGLSAARHHMLPKQICSLLHTSGLISQWRGDLAQAEASWREGLTIARQERDPETLCHLLGVLGGMLCNPQRYDEAAPYLQEGFFLAQQIDSRPEMCHFFIGLGVLEWHRRNEDRALFYWQEGLSLARQMQLFPALAILLLDLGEVAQRQGDSNKAEAYLQEGLDFAVRKGHRHFVSVIASTQGVIYLERKDLERAEAAFQKALTNAPDSDYESLARASYGLARVCRLRGEEVHAQEQGRRSLLLFEKIKSSEATEVQQWLHDLDPFSPSLPA